VIRPIPRPDDSVNQSAPSGPDTIDDVVGWLVSMMVVNVPPNVRLPIAGRASSVNQSAPSGPTVIAFGPPGGGTWNSLTWPTVASATPAAASDTTMPTSAAQRRDRAMAFSSRLSALAFRPTDY